MTRLKTSDLDRLSPVEIAEAGEAALANEDLADALALFDRAEPGVEDADRCAGGRWMAHMLRGDFEAAWRESDAIRRRGRPDPHRFWEGEELQGKRVILRCLHGFGDAVQIFRFLPRLQALVSHLIVEVPPRLFELAPYFAGMGEVITWGEHAPATPPAWDVQIELMELPYLFRATTADLDPQHGYVQVPQPWQARVAEVLGPANQPRVGVVWSAGEWNPSRSIPFEDFSSLLDMDGITFFSLQGDPERQRWASLEQGPERRDVYEVGDGIAALAATIAGMDLVITVDTLAAHLAGALNVPCWLLLQHRADWRWMSRCDASPWYPSLLLQRQTAPGDWAGLVHRTRDRLQAWAEKRRNSSPAFC